MKTSEKLKEEIIDALFDSYKADQGNFKYFCELLDGIFDEDQGKVKNNVDQEEAGSVNCPYPTSVKNCKCDEEYQKFLDLPKKAKYDMVKLRKLLEFSSVYEINIQFWPQMVTVYITKHDVDLTDFGGDFDFAVDKSIEYLMRITGGGI